MVCLVPTAIAVAAAEEDDLSLHGRYRDGAVTCQLPTVTARARGDRPRAHHGHVAHRHAQRVQPHRLGRLFSRRHWDDSEPKHVGTVADSAFSAARCVHGGDLVWKIKRQRSAAPIETTFALAFVHTSFSFIPDGPQLLLYPLIITVVAQLSKSPTHTHLQPILISNPYSSPAHTHLPPCSQAQSQRAS